jgi:hypothetical protein
MVGEILVDSEKDFRVCILVERLSQVSERARRGAIIDRELARSRATRSRAGEPQARDFAQKRSPTALRADLPRV